jgi:hypothetical protein
MRSGRVKQSSGYGYSPKSPDGEVVVQAGTPPRPKREISGSGGELAYAGHADWRRGMEGFILPTTSMANHPIDEVTLCRRPGGRTAKETALDMVYYVNLDLHIRNFFIVFFIRFGSNSPIFLTVLKYHF